VIDPRNRPALIGAVVAGAGAFGLLWALGVPILLAWLVGWSVPAFAMYGIDKRQAHAGGWRIPEAVLHALALVGGVMGAWAGRAIFHHKTQERMFLVVLVFASALWAAVIVMALR
jgi:uncharacterized membrane protein YsdA (DUF1294 family)